MLTQKDKKIIRSRLDKIYKTFLSKKDIDYFENKIDQIIHQLEVCGLKIFLKKKDLVKIIF